MHLKSLREQPRSRRTAQLRIRCPARPFHTENSYKYTPESFLALAREAGFGAHRMWSDPARWFGVFFLHN
jgi:uncharacterized SAM-dependent methyltransferase